MKRSFFGELSRRNVIQAAALYLASGWLLVQIATQVFPFFDIPNRVVRAIVVAVIAGFPVALIFSWFYEWTPQGFKREVSADQDLDVQRPRSRRIDGAIIGVLSLAVIFLLVNYFMPRGESAQKEARRSIAVLPFENMSSEPDNAYFADGIQDEILTRLAKIGELRVISRTSTQRYSAKGGNVRDIGRELGVAMVLEGSVRRVDKAVRVSVQLISATSDEQVWAESYDRKLDDVLGVESDIAQAVASTLHIQLSGGQAAVVAARPTANAEAYDLYLRALAAETRAAGLAYDRHHVASLYEGVVRLDPQFALAWAHLAIVRSYMVFSFFDRSADDAAAMKAAAKEAVDKALALDPELGEAHLALGFYRFRCLRDFAGGLVAFEQARQRLPNNAEVLASIAYIERRQGNWRESLEHLNAATLLDPRDLALFSELSATYGSLRDFTNARRALDRALEIEPDSMSLLGLKAQTYQDEGNLAEAARLLKRVPVRKEDFYNFSIHIDQLLYERHFDEVIDTISGVLSKPSDDLVAIEAYCRIVAASAQRWKGESQQSQANFQLALKAGLRVRKSEADDVQLAQFFAVVYAGLGDKENALAMAKRNVALNADDSVALPRAQALLARVQADFGDQDAAVAALPHLLEVPAGPTLAELRLHPMWDPLRANPRFQALIAPANGAGSTH